MDSGDWREELPARVRVLRIIVAAMVLGCVVMLGVVLAVSASFPGSPGLDVLTIVAVCLAAGSLIVRAIVPKVLAAAGRKTILAELRKTEKEEREGTRGERFDKFEGEAAHRLTTLAVQKTVMSAAPLEGAAFFCFIAYLVTRSPIALAVGVAMIVILAIHFPSVERTSNWIEDQLRLLREQY